MSGVRAHNPELTALGLTLPGFVERSRVVASLPSLGLLTLAALTPSSIDVHYVEVPGLPPGDDVPGEFDAVAISSYTAQIKEAYVLAQRYRTRGTKVILGGLHVTAVPEEAAQNADAVVPGEGEVAWPPVMSDLIAGKLRPLYDVRLESFDLANAPVPRYELLDPARYNRLTVQTQRGCPFRCEFCAASIQISPKYKLKPVDRVITELREIKKLWPRPFIEFADDNSFVNKKHSKQLLRAIAEENIRWFTETDISIAEDPEMLALMRDSGCAQVLIGLESTSLSGLNGLEQKSNWKSQQLSRYKAAIDRIQDHGITVNGCFILGLDGAGPDSFDEIYKFVKETRLYEVQITVQTPFPGTPLYRRLQRERRLLKEHAWELCTLFDVNFVPAQMTVSDLEQGIRNLAERLYNDEFTRQRRAGFISRRRAPTFQHGNGDVLQ